MLISAAVMLPMADNACNNPRAYGRARSGITSATSENRHGKFAATPSP